MAWRSHGLPPSAQRPPIDAAIVAAAKKKGSIFWASSTTPLEQKGPRFVPKPKFQGYKTNQTNDLLLISMVTARDEEVGGQISLKTQEDEEVGGWHGNRRAVQSAQKTNFSPPPLFENFDSLCGSFHARSLDSVCRPGRSRKQCALFTTSNCDTKQNRIKRNERKHQSQD